MPENTANPLISTPSKPLHSQAYRKMPSNTPTPPGQLPNTGWDW